MNIFSGQTCVVTGGGSGIGKALSELLLQRGATVYAVDISADGCRDIVLLLFQIFGVVLHYLAASVELLAFGWGCCVKTAHTTVGAGPDHCHVGHVGVGDPQLCAVLHRVGTQEARAGFDGFVVGFFVFRADFAPIANGMALDVPEAVAVVPRQCFECAWRDYDLA